MTDALMQPMYLASSKVKSTLNFNNCICICDMENY